MKKLIFVFASFLLSLSPFVVYATEVRMKEPSTMTVLLPLDKTLCIPPAIVKNADNVEENIQPEQSTTALTILHKEQEKQNIHEIELRNYRNGDVSAKYYFEHPISEDWSIYLSAFKTKGWDEMTVGPVYYITPDMSIGIGVGTSRYMASDEIAKSYHTTISAFWFLKSENWEAEILAERYRRDSVNPSFVEAYVQRKVTESFSVGIMAQTDLGWGPRFQYEINKNWSIWALPLLHKKGDTTAVIGVKLSF